MRYIVRDRKTLVWKKFDSLEKAREFAAMQAKAGEGAWIVFNSDRSKVIGGVAKRGNRLFWEATKEIDPKTGRLV